MNKVKTDQSHMVFYKNWSPEKTLGSELGEKYDRYRESWNRASKGELVSNFPIHLTFELFYGCNFRCPMCILSVPLKKRFYKEEPRKKINFEKYCEIIDEGVKNDLCSVQLSGTNEPLLLKDIAKYIRYAKKAGVTDIYIITNASLLTPEKSREIIEAGLTQIKFSVDSINKETYEKIRVGGNFEQTMENINEFLEIKKAMGRKLPVTRVSFVKTKQNIDQVDGFVDYWTDKVDYVTTQELFNPFTDGENNLTNATSLSDKSSEFEKSFRADSTVLDKCYMPYQRAFIRNNGDILPCCSIFGIEISVGNIYKNSIYEIWNSKNMDELRINVNGSADVMPLTCKKCRNGVENQEAA